MRGVVLPAPLRIMAKTIAVIASLDTKAKEVMYVLEGIRRLGYQTLVIDVGVKGEQPFKANFGPEDVAAAAGLAWSEIKIQEKRVRITAMARGLEALVPMLYAQGRFSAVLSLGGAQNTLMGTSAMRALPLGVPKLMVSTMASGNRTFDPLVGTKDLMLMHSVADISGINLITTSVLDNAVAAICGMAGRAGSAVQHPGHLVIGASMLGVTNDGVCRAVSLLEESGFEAVTFHTTGAGGRALEDLIREGLIGAVLDLTLHEIVCEFFGGYASGANNRLIAAAEAGIPQVVTPGAADVVDYSVTALEGLPDWETRPHIYQAPTILHLKLHPEETAVIGSVIAERLSASRGPVTVVWPRGGLHQFSFPNGPLWYPETDEALLRSLREGLRPDIRVIEVDANINDPAFSEAASRAMLELLERRT